MRAVRPDTPEGPDGICKHLFTFVQLLLYYQLILQLLELVFRVPLIELEVVAICFRRLAKVPILTRLAKVFRLDNFRRTILNQNICNCKKWHGKFLILYFYLFFLEIISLISAFCCFQALYTDYLPDFWENLFIFYVRPLVFTTTKLS